MDLRKSLFGNIVLSGGSTLAKGFGDRLLHEVQRLAVKDMRIKIFAPPERKYSTWIGGSILAGLSTFRKVFFDAVEFLAYSRCGSTLTIGTKIPTSSTPSLIEDQHNGCQYLWSRQPTELWINAAQLDAHSLPFTRLVHATTHT